MHALFLSDVAETVNETMTRNRPMIRSLPRLAVALTFVTSTIAGTAAQAEIVRDAMLATSGQLDYMKNASISNRLQQLDMTYTYVNKLEDMHWDIIIQNLSPELRSVVNYNTFKPVLPDRLYAVELQNIFVESIYMTAYKDDAYRQAIAAIDTLLVLIDREVGPE